MVKKQNVLLVTPAAPIQAPFSTTEKRPPLGIGFLISVLRNAGHKVFFIDNYLRPQNFLEKGFLWKNRIDFVGIQANTICFRDVLRMLHKMQYLRQKGKWNGKIVVGGPHTTVAPDTIPEFVDYVVQGEGEQALLDIVEGKVKNKLVRYPAIENLDDLPMPAWDYFVRLPYNWSVDWFEKQPVFTMNTSRGCPFGCTFCSVGSIWGKQYTYFSASRLVRDIEFLVKRYKVKGIYFREDNFTLNRKRLIEFCNLLLEKKLDISWACETRVTTIDRETVALMHQSGARAFYFGVESGSQRILDFLKKGITVDQIKNAFALCREIGIKTAASVIVGVPSETKEDVTETQRLLDEIKPTVTWHNVFVGIPNSELYRYVLENNLYEYIDDRGLVYLRGHNDRARKFYGNSWDAHIPFDAQQPGISVVMSVYNGQKHIEAAIKSVLTQTYQNFEFIIIDDASTDQTPEILRNLYDPRIRLYRNHTNLGLTKSLNRGVNYAKGACIARMDADDISLPHRFDTQLTFLEHNPDHALVGSSYYQIDDVGQIVTLVEVLTDSSGIRKGLKKQNWFGHGSVMMRKAAFIDVGGYNEAFEFSQDYDLWIRLAEKYKLANIEEPLYCWRSSATGISSAKRGKQDFYAQMAVTKGSKPGNGPLLRKSSRPLVSVIIPTYNRPAMLAEAVRSVLQQTYEDVEIIVVNDSGIKVEGIVISLNKKGNISYVRHARNRGLSAARNTGIALSRGEYIAYLDDDDVFLPHHIESLVTFMEDGDHKIAYSDAYRAFQTRQGDSYTISNRDTPFSLDFDHDRILAENFIPVLCVIHKKECLQKAGLFDENLRRLEDWDLWIRMSQEYSFAHLKEITCEFRWRDDGTSMVTGPDDAFAWAVLNMLHKYSDIAQGKPEIKRIHREMVANATAALKESLIGALDTNRSEPVIFFEENVNASVAKLTELKGKYPELLCAVDDLMALFGQMEDRMNRVVQSKTLTDTLDSSESFGPKGQDSQDALASLADQMVMKDEYIRALEGRTRRLEGELRDIKTSNGWALLTRYYKARDLLTARKKP
ncbi:MAG: putative glycosyltransferase EpsE [Syntrophorhabdus sp. PtaU1.Bin153]|nr:MAG: putative glycosyltransferase EpsE [Syntrophorhabdus sp. PtaU1.Bin153]